MRQTDTYTEMGNSEFYLFPSDSKVKDKVFCVHAVKVHRGELRYNSTHS